MRGCFFWERRILVLSTGRELTGIIGVIRIMRVIIRVIKIERFNYDCKGNKAPYAS